MSTYRELEKPRYNIIVTNDTYGEPISFGKKVGLTGKIQFTTEEDLNRAQAEDLKFSFFVPVSLTASEAINVPTQENVLSSSITRVTYTNKEFYRIELTLNYVNMIESYDGNSEHFYIDFMTGKTDTSGQIIQYLPVFGTDELTSQTLINYSYEAAAPVKVLYVDEKGEILFSEDIEGEVGDKYSTAAKQIAGYSLGTTPENAEGVFTNQPQTVTYVYTKDATITPPVTTDKLEKVQQSSLENSKELPQTGGDEIKTFIGALSGVVVIFTTSLFNTSVFTKSSYF